MTGESLVNIRFTASRLGVEHNDIKLLFQKKDMQIASLPQINVVDDRIEIVLNATPNNYTTAGELVEAISNDVDARSLIFAELIPDQTGATNEDQNIVLDVDLTVVSPIELGGADDIVVKPGFVGVGDSSNELVVRFADTLPDDLYRIDVFCWRRLYSL